ncbi:MAG: hypothetical protein FWH57_05825 [Oscillospiraceae bacterium]|nr:hypothetical protein [Oscillospiraceae bacterium]
MIQIIRLTWKGIRGRGLQSLLLLMTLTFASAFVTAALCYFESAKTTETETRYDLYGQWQIAQYGLGLSEAGEFLSLTSPDAVGTLTQLGAIVGESLQQIGSVGFADDGFFEVGRIVPLSGRLPVSKDEIAVTANLLDSIGHSYELGRSVSFNITPSDFWAGDPEDLETYTVTFVLCGVLPSYETYWSTGINQPVNAFVAQDAELPDYGKVLTHTFCLFIGAPINTAFLRVNDGTGVLNEAAYPDSEAEETQSSLIIAAVLLLLVFAVAQLFISALRKRSRQMGVMSAIGAPRAWILSLCLWEAAFYLLLSLPTGTLLGLGLCYAGLLSQGSALFFTVPAGRLIVSLSLCLMASFIGFLLPALLVMMKQPDNTSVLQKRVRLRRRIGFALPVLRVETLMAALCLILPMLCAGMGYRRMMPYYVNKDIAAINVTARMNRALSQDLIDDLLSIPGVKLVSAVSQLKESVFMVSSPSIQQSAMLQDIYRSSLLDETGNWMMVDADTYNTQLYSPWQPDLEALAAACESPVADMDAIYRGDDVLIYLPYYEYNSEKGTYHFISDPSDNSLSGKVDAGLEVGQTLSLTAIAAPRDEKGYNILDEAGDPIILEFTKEVKIGGIIRSFPIGSLMTNGNPSFAGNIVSSKSLHQEMSRSLLYSDDIANGYSSVNIRMNDNADYAVRRSIASIVQKREGLITANSYELVDQYYQSGSQGMFLFSIAGILLGIIALILMHGIFLARMEAARYGIGTLVAIGMDQKSLKRVYLKRGVFLCAVALAIANVLTWAAQIYIKLTFADAYLIKIFEQGSGTAKAASIPSYPWSVHLIVCTVVTLFILYMHIVSLRSFIKKTSIENMKGT